MLRSHSWQLESLLEQSSQLVQWWCWYQCSSGKGILTSFYFNFTVYTRTHLFCFMCKFTKYSNKYMNFEFDRHISRELFCNHLNKCLKMFTVLLGEHVHPQYKAMAFTLPSHLRTLNKTTSTQCSMVHIYIYSIFYFINNS